MSSMLLHWLLLIFSIFILNFLVLWLVIAFGLSKAKNMPFFDVALQMIKNNRVRLTLIGCSIIVTIGVILAVQIG